MINSISSIELNLKERFSLICRTMMLGALILSIAVIPEGCGTSNAEKKAADKAVKEAIASGNGFQTLLGDELINTKGEKFGVDSLDGKIVGLYFGASWCPPCRAFVPDLVKVYNTIKEDSKPFEVVFVTSDRDEEEMMGYMKKYNMPWLALDYENEHVAKLRAHYEVRGIPSFIVLGPDGSTISKNGRGDIADKEAAAFHDWSEKAGL